MLLAYKKIIATSSNDQLQFCCVLHVILAQRLFLHKCACRAACCKKQREWVRTTNWFLLKCHPGEETLEMNEFCYAAALFLRWMSLMRYKSRAIIIDLFSVKHLRAINATLRYYYCWLRLVLVLMSEWGKATRTVSPMSCGAAKRQKRD